MHCDATVEVISTYEVSDDAFDVLHLQDGAVDSNNASLILNSCRYWVYIDHMQIENFLQSCSGDAYSALTFKDGEFWLVRGERN